MKMYSFDDKAEQVELSHEAIRSAGHEVAEISYRRSNRYAEKLAKEKDYSAGYQVYGRQNGYGESLFWEIRAAVAKMAEENGGIITDLMFHNWSHKEGSSTPPAGLLVVIECLAQGVPVVVCTDEDHHGDAVGWIYDGYVRMFYTNKWRRDMPDSPFGWVDNKDWNKAVAILAEMRAKTDSPATS